MIRSIGTRLTGLIATLLLLSACGSEPGPPEAPAPELDPEARLQACTAALAGQPLEKPACTLAQHASRVRGGYPSAAELGIELRPREGAVPSASGDRAAASGRAVDDYVLRVVSLTGRPFDWNRADPEVLCAATTTRSPHVRLTVESAFRIDAVLAEVARVTGEAQEVRWRSDRLGSVRIVAPPCSCLEAVRSIPGVRSVEPGWPLDLAALLGEGGRKGTPSRAVDVEEGLDPFNPGLYDPENDGSYLAYIRKHSSFDAHIMERHRLAEVFDRYGVPTHPEIGVAVLDNGVHPEWVDDYSTGFGRFRFEGHRRNGLTGRLDGPHPLENDFFWLSPRIPGSFDHGTRQLGHVQSFAPHATRASKRSASIVFLLLHADFEGVLEAIEAVAEDPELHVISMSMGTLFHSDAIASAVAELNRQGKILVSAAGTLPLTGLKDLLPVIFPANLRGTVSATGIQDPEQNGGEFVLGDAAFGGPENDFVVDRSSASSEATSTTAGTIATLWALNPARSREEVLAALVASSTFFRERGEKHPVFGWGMADALEAARIVLGEKPFPAQLRVCEGIRR